MQRCRLAFKTEGGKNLQRFVLLNQFDWLHFVLKKTTKLIRFHVQAQPGWQTFKHFRDEEKRFVFGGSLLTNIANLIQIVFDSFTHNVRQKSCTNYKFPFLCLSFYCAA